MGEGDDWPASACDETAHPPASGRFHPHAFSVRLVAAAAAAPGRRVNSDWLLSPTAVLPLTLRSR